jgi:hypothetical protein
MKLRKMRRQKMNAMLAMERVTIELTDETADAIRAYYGGRIRCMSGLVRDILYHYIRNNREHQSHAN